MHSADYKSASGWKGKRGLVIGTANTGKWQEKVSNLSLMDV